MPEENNNKVAKVTKQDVALAISNGTIADSILANFDKLSKQNQLVFPKGYNIGNQLKLMYTSLSQNDGLSKATSMSIGEALTEAVIQGLEVDKKQCYFICYGNKMTMFRSYYGDIAVAKRTGLVKDIRARVIYEGDVYELDTDEYGETYVTGHKTKLENMDNQIIGAYAWAEQPNGRRTYAIMTWKEIQANWSKSKAGGGVQKEFPQEMAKRTVIRRLVKMIFNTSPTDLSDEAAALIGSFNRTTENEYDNKDYSESNTSGTTVTNRIIEADMEVDDDGVVQDTLQSEETENN